MDSRFLVNEALYREVVLERLMHARESVWMSTANLKDMQVQQNGKFVSITRVFAALARRNVQLRILHAELPSRPFRASFDKQIKTLGTRLELKICPRVHFKCVLVDGAWVYLGSANLTGAGLGAKHENKRNFEVGFVTEDFDVIDRTQALFQSIWSGAECGLCRVRDLCPDPLGPSLLPSRRGRTRKSPGGIELGRSRRIFRP